MPSNKPLWINFEKRLRELKEEPKKLPKCPYCGRIVNPERELCGGCGAYHGKS